MTSHDVLLSHSPAGQLLAMSPGPFNGDAPRIEVSPVTACCAQVLTLAHSVSSALWVEETVPAVPDHPGQT